MLGGGGVELRAIAAEDVTDVATFLHEELNSRVSVASWARAMTPPWSSDWPDHGLHLRHEGRVVGAQLAFYSSREVDGRPQEFCNLGAWCVLEEHRSSGLRLLRGLLRRRQYTFTDLSPSGNVVELNRRLQFVDLDTTTVAVPGLPRPTGRVRVSTDPHVVDRALAGPSRRVFDDHRSTPAAHHALVTDGERDCYVLFRRDRRKRLPLFATVLHASEPEVFRRTAPALARHLMLRQGLPVTLVEPRVVGGRPAGSVLLRGSRPRMFRSEHLGPEHIDYLYSELTCVAW